MPADGSILFRRLRRLVSRAATVGGFLLLMLHMSSMDAAAQRADTARSITIPLPEPGVVYIRSGTPGGVRIRSRMTDRRRQTAGEAAPPASPGALVRSDAFDPVDLSRLEALLGRQGLNLDVGLARRGGEDVVVLRRRSDAVQTIADTLSLAEANRLLETLGGRAMQGSAGPATVPPLVVRVERSILEAGLFRSLQVHFEFDRSELLATADPTLDAVAAVLQRFPELRIEVAGHADSVGPDAYNRDLSARRAERVRLSLVDRGVAPDRIRAEGYGESQPVLPNRTATGRALNRRVEFVLLNPEAAEPYRLEMRESRDDELERLRQSIREGIREGFETDRNDKD